MMSFNDIQRTPGIGDDADAPWAPVIPAGPCTPVIPAEPCTPVIPVEPCAPVIPGDPCTPVIPVEPCGPVIPAGPAGPVHPTANNAPAHSGSSATSSRRFIVRPPAKMVSCDVVVTVDSIGCHRARVVGLGPYRPRPSGCEMDQSPIARPVHGD